MPFWDELKKNLTLKEKIKKIKICMAIFKLI